MREIFLHFIWQHQYFSKENLTTQNGESVDVLSTGHYNTDGGPDFLNARIKIGDIIWYGNVEIHIRSSDWKSHKHQHNQAYDNVILHVVFKNDREIERTDGSKIPTIALMDRVDKGLYEKYAQLVSSNSPSVPCSTHLPRLPSILKVSMSEKALVSRLHRKGTEVIKLLKDNEGDWEQTTYQLLCKNFGFKLNSDPFQRLAASLPLKILKKHKDIFQLEALLFGSSGLLARNFKDQYPQNLQKEYGFLAHKYNLQSEIGSTEWKFLRLRPANFPTLRIAQVAAIIASTDTLFTVFSESDSPEIISGKLCFAPSGYWQNHYSFEKPSIKPIGIPGKSSLISLVINTSVPILAALARLRDQEELMERAISFLEKLPAENNRITKIWLKNGFELKNAADSQAVTELFNAYCKNRLCLNCNIGVTVVKN